LQKQLWPDDTVVGFEDGINTAINKLRHALGDDPDQPRYVETLPRRGYRFIHPVSTAGAGLAPPRPLHTGGEPPAAPTPTGADVPMAFPPKNLPRAGDGPRGHSSARLPGVSSAGCGRRAQRLC
jgi:DNA-binding winged helix-turn-helix (wHTH) protein